MLLQGIDISKYQRVLSWAAVAREAKYVWMRASLGYGTDYKIAEHHRDSFGHLPRGLYHVAWNSTEAPANGQLAHMLKMCEMYPCELPLALDVERADIGFEIVLFLGQGYFDKYGKYPIIYTSIGWWNNRWAMLGNRDRERYEPFFIRCDLWTAHYGVDTPGQVNPWKNTIIHQYSKSGRNEGIEGYVDLNQYLCATEDFYTHFGLSSSPQPPLSPQPKRVVITANFLRFRPTPEYKSCTTLIVEKNQILEVAGEPFHEEASDITWLPVKYPIGYAEGIAYISANSKYVREI